MDYLLDKNPLLRIGPKPTLTGIFYAYKVVAKYQQEMAAKGPEYGHAEHYLDKYLKLCVSNPVPWKGFLIEADCYY